MPTLRLISWNIAQGRGPGHPLHRRSRGWTVDGIAEVLRREQPDLVALQEVVRADLQPLVHGSGLAHYHQAHPISGTALLSARPWLSTRAGSFGCSWRDDKDWVAGVVPWGDGELEVFSVHLDFLNPRVRRRQARSLLDALRIGADAVVAGDLNTPSDGGAVEELTRGLRLVGPDEATFPSSRPRLRLDRVLAPTSIEVRSARVLDDPWSDHRAVLVELSVP